MPDHSNEPSATTSNERFTVRNNRFALAAAGLLAIGGAAGAVTVAATRPSVTMAPATPVAIRSLQSDGIVTIRGTVAEVYGDKFVMADRTGRALVDLGPEGSDSALVTAGQPVTIQGRFEDGFVHASFLVGAGGKVTALGPIGRPPRGPHGPGGPGRDGPGGPERGPEGGPDRGPAAPPPAALAPQSPTAAPGTMTRVPGTAPTPTVPTATTAQRATPAT
ncbi:MAG TPA: hypothetical protein VNJ10_10365 [Sphingomonas sp.]|nr:hypothetical protein [Sphingomonas sp.]